MEGEDQDGASRLISYEHHDKYRISPHLRDHPPREYDYIPITKDEERTTSPRATSRRRRRRRHRVGDHS
jgi:hypothetical protein